MRRGWGSTAFASPGAPCCSGPQLPPAVPTPYPSIGSSSALTALTVLLRATLTSHGELSESHRADADALMAQFGRKVSFVTLDGGRYRLNTQPRILKKGEPSRSLGAPRVVLFHREASVIIILLTYFMPGPMV